MTNPDNKEAMIELFKNAIKDSKIKLIDFVPFNEIIWTITDKKNQTFAYNKKTEHYKTVYGIGKTFNSQTKFINNKEYLSTNEETFEKEFELIQINFETEPSSVNLYIAKGYSLKEKIGRNIFLKKKGLINYFKTPIEVTELHLSLDKPWTKIGFKSIEEDIEAVISIEEYNSLYVAFGLEIHRRKINNKPENKLQSLSSSYKSKSTKDCNVEDNSSL